MKIKTSQLTGAALDWAVAKCEGATNLRHDTVATWWVDFGGEPKALSSGWSPRQSWHPSTNWSQGGPIIDREKITTAYEPSMVYDDSCRWKALAAMSDNEHQYGPTPLTAAMRCYVASKLGDEVDAPDLLVQTKPTKKS